MIKIENLNKYYNKSKNNEIHVINNVSFELPSTGLVCFIGKSGSGKTTLLNTLGGLDKANSGKITFDDLAFNKYNMKKIDSFRKNNIGYIFQNYLLIEDKSIYDNLKIALEVIDIYDQEEQKKRIEYVLKSVGLYKFRKKLANKLSGGQQQRVSIARCLLKECKIIIADEPTGNLDSENTIEIMNILKKISEKTLVLVVTHNKDVASFYADRMIELSDGAITNDSNGNNSGSLNISNDRQIYLKDLCEEQISNDNISISLYKEDKEEKVDIRIVVKNGTIYLDSSQPLVLAKQSNVEFIDDHYKHLEKEALKDFDFDISFYNDNKKKPFFLLLFQLLKRAFQSFFNVRKREKIFHVIFFFIGIILAVCMISYANYSVINDKDFCKEKDVFYITSTDKPTYLYEDIDRTSVRNIINDGLISNVYDGKEIYTTSSFVYNSKRKETIDITVYRYPISKIKNPIYLAGNECSGSEIVIGKQTADYLIENISFYKKYEDIIGNKIRNYTISGVISENTNTIYFENNYYYQNVFNTIVPYYEKYEERWYEDKIEYEYVGYRNAFEINLISGRDISNVNEIIVRDDSGFKIDDEIVYKNEFYTIVGIYDNDINYPVLSISDNIIGLYLEGNNLVNYDYEIKDPSIISNQNINFSIDTLRNSLSKDIENDNEVLVNVNSKYKIGDEIYIYNENPYKVVGYYISSEVDNDFIIANNKTFILDSFMRLDNATFEISAQGINDIKARHQYVFSPYDFSYSRNSIMNKEDRTVSLVIMIVLLSISIIYVYFSTRSRMIIQIKDIGVYRSIGASRFSIIKKYIANIFAYTTLTTLLGYVISIILYSAIYSKISSLLGNDFILPIGLYLFGILIIYALNIAIGIIPVLMLLRKTPAEINAKYDI